MKAILYNQKHGNNFTGKHNTFYIRVIIISAILIFTSGTLYSQTKNQKTEKTYPNIFLLKKSKTGFVSIDDFKNLPAGERQAKYLEKLKNEVERDLQYPFITPATDVEGRDLVHLKHINVSSDMTGLLGNRLSKSSFMFLFTDEERYKTLVLSQIEALYDTTLWPFWCDKAHMDREPYLDIRTCRISMWIALSYNWLHDYLSDDEKAFIIKGLNERAIEPFWIKLKQKPGWYTHRHNWFSNIFGGMGITAMALGDDHPETRQLLDTIVPAMIEYHKVFGEMGEFNEPPGYTGATVFSVEFAEAYRYYINNKRNLLNEDPFPQVCYWMMHHTLPPGRRMAFGDTPVDGKPGGQEVMAAVANAANDGILQWYYLNNFDEISSIPEFLWYNPKLQPVNPQNVLPLGKEYKEYSASLISRTSWDQKITDCVAYGKAGRENNHDDNDVGQLLIDGFGERLIIDPGKPKPIYPADYFSKTQYNYYTRSSLGHNVVVIDNQEMKSEPNEDARGKTIRSWFNDSIGSFWEIDLTPVYPNAKKVTRKVAHFFPGIVAVYDQVYLDEAKPIDLRWHTITSPQLVTSNGFVVKNEKAALSAKIVPLDNSLIEISTGHHEFKSPYNLTRQGDPLDQHFEPFVKISANGKSFAILSLFAIVENRETIPEWKKTESGWAIKCKGIDYQIEKQQNEYLIFQKSAPEKSITFGVE